MSGESQDQVRSISIRLLNFLGEQGLKVSQSKLQFVEPEVKFLGHLIGRGYKKLSLERISGVLSIGAPKTKRGGRLWIEQNPERVKFLYEKLVSPDPIHRMSKDEKQLQSLKIKLSRALVLSLPNLNKDFICQYRRRGSNMGC